MIFLIFFLSLEICSVFWLILSINFVRVFSFGIMIFFINSSEGKCISYFLPPEKLILKVSNFIELVPFFNPRVFPIFGFTSNPRFELKKFTLSPKRPKIGSSVAISFDLVSQSNRRQKLAIDYRVHYQKKNGGMSSKVFKLSEKTIPANSTLNISTRHSFEDRSTRKHYRGRHRLELIVNGKSAYETAFHLA